MPSPLGEVGVAADARGICQVTFAPRVAGSPAPRGSILAAAVAQLAAYFAGELTDFDLPLSRAGSEFELAVWHALTEIPYGQTRSYGDIAARIGQPGAARAVGLANNHNPLPIIVPCHRVVGADRTLVGYGAGLPRKRWLLELEARLTLERDFAC